jgi:putative transposase
MTEMQDGKTRWSHYSIAYHFVWIPKYRRKILIGAVEAATKSLLREACDRYGFILLALETDIDHVHVFVSAPPKDSPSSIVGRLKGYSSRKLREKFPELKRLCGEDELWTKTYYVGTAGHVSVETIRRYISDSQGQ